MQTCLCGSIQFRFLDCADATCNGECSLVVCTDCGADAPGPINLSQVAA